MSTTTELFTLVINPQLCKTYNNEPFDKLMYVEPKLDGLRGLVVVDKDPETGEKRATAYSRNGKPFWNIEHILEEYVDLPWNNYVLDGEFYATDWNTSMSILKRTSDHPDKMNIRFHVWDVIPLEAWINGRHTVKYSERRKILEKGFSALNYTQVVKSLVVNSNQELGVAYEQLLLAGYEGGILKDPDGIYVLGSRSKDWLKLKPWTDADLLIVDAGEGKGRNLGRLGFLVLEGEAEWKGKTHSVKTEVGTGFSDDQREKFWKLFKRKKLVGQIAEIKFQEVTVDGSCRFPVFHRLRVDK
jgi:ATP-dependent DNA ligase